MRAWASLWGRSGCLTLELGPQGLTLRRLADLGFGKTVQGGQAPGTEARQVGVHQPWQCPAPHSSSEWNNVDPYEREQLRIKMEDGEFW